MKDTDVKIGGEVVRYHIESAKKCAILFIKYFFRGSDAGDYQFNDWLCSAENEDIYIQGLTVEYSTNGEIVVSVYGDNDSETVEDELENLSVANLLQIVDELEKKKISQIDRE